MKEQPTISLIDSRERQQKREGILKSRTALITKIGTGAIKPDTTENKLRINQLKGRLQYSVYWYRARIAEDTVEISRSVSPNALALAEKELEYVLFDYTGWQERKKKTTEFQEERKKRLEEIEDLRGPVVSELLFQQALRNVNLLNAPHHEEKNTQKELELNQEQGIDEHLPITVVVPSRKESQREASSVQSATKVEQKIGKRKKVEEVEKRTFIAKSAEKEVELTNDEYLLLRRISGRDFPVFEEDFPRLQSDIVDVIATLRIKLGEGILNVGFQADRIWLRRSDNRWKIEEKQILPPNAIMRGSEIIMLTDEEYKIFALLNSTPHQTQRSDLIFKETGIKAGPVIKSLISKLGEGSIIQTGSKRGTAYGITIVESVTSESPGVPINPVDSLDHISSAFSVEDVRSKELPDAINEHTVEQETQSNILTRELAGYLGEILVSHNNVHIINNGSSFVFSLSEDLHATANALRNEVKQDSLSLREQERIFRAKKRSTLEIVGNILEHDEVDTLIEAYSDPDIYHILLDLHTHPQLEFFHGHVIEFLSDTPQNVGDRREWVLPKEQNPRINTWIEEHDWRARKNITNAITRMKELDAPMETKELRELRGLIKDMIMEFVDSRETYKKYTGKTAHQSNRARFTYTIFDTILFAYLQDFKKMHKRTSESLTPDNLLGIKELISEIIAEKNLIPQEE